MIEEKVKEIISKEFEIEITDISSDFSQENIPNWDSLKHLNLIVAIEAAFDIEFEPEEIAEMYDIHSILKLTEQKMTGK